MDTIGRDDRPSVAVKFFGGLEGYRPPRSLLIFMAAWLLAIILGSLSLRAFHIELHGAHAAFAAAVVFAPGVFAAPLGVCTCTLTAHAFLFKPSGLFGSTDTTLISEIRTARVVQYENPALELTLKTGDKKRFGPWKPLTSFASLDDRQTKLSVLAESINRAASRGAIS